MLANQRAGARSLRIGDGGAAALVIGVGNAPAHIAPPIGSDAIALLVAIANLIATDFAARQVHYRQKGGADRQEGMDVRLHDLLALWLRGCGVPALHPGRPSHPL